MKHSIAILGASGYTGAETIRLALTHPQMHIAALTGESQAGKSIGEVYPHLAHHGLPSLTTINTVDFSAIDTVFCCLPHATTQTVVASLPQHLKIIDLSADFRLHDTEAYAQWYGQPHAAPDLQPHAVYGLSEHARAAIATARLVANPGCYPTAAQLPLIPLLKHQNIIPETIIIDAKSGITGAGRAAKQGMLYSETAGGLSAYGIGNHRHTPEIEQGLSAAAGKPVPIRFTPHLVPMKRGILATIYVDLAPNTTLDDLRATLSQAYNAEPFVHLATPGIYPATQHVAGSNHCIINVFADRIPGKAVVVSVIDNLVKGAAGQAVQNFNIMHGLAETTGLEAGAIFP